MEQPLKQAFGEVQGNAGICKKLLSTCGKIPIKEVNITEVKSITKIKKWFCKYLTMIVFTGTAHFM